ncbi:MAG: inositol monophosphatase [Rhizobiales bacterium 24-66-13]|jgi:myo-inositol-1(or 4)-monophosphatase|uniref:inositol monophosphatase family protein n=1 Tax=Roseixanthobacter finlandensis TaxID=3119922 RepID=UPI000BCD06A4|nr:MAG: inositol monophosphatase [Rhizobiales bacterium 24-66-13]OZB09118.1 MAG: inositol monophosphatase [Rhizobiales bacterium 39-66-18]HQS11231.1 inositol monophosphatase family protein [Xanthobacteraceae bacterium]HQS46456.1 inositol monophosphatase family protein [Xanthobacteraceae bacterium]
MIRSPLITVMVQAVRKAARGLTRDFGEVENLQVSVKGPADFVSAADRKAEDILFTELSRSRPGFSFLMEERGRVEGTDPANEWVIDPLDGTTNFLHGIPLFAISVALVRNGAPFAGVIFNPVTDELFVAEKGQGAYLNDRRLRVAGRRKLAESVVCCGLPHMGRGDHTRFNRELAKVQTQVAGLRRTGAAALDLAWVAAGRFDAFWERNLSAWDMAAGILMVREAGGYVSDLDGGDQILEKGDVIAGNEDMRRDLLALLKAA